MRYKVSLTTKLRPPQTGLIVIEPEDYTSAEVKALKASGATILAYLSAGSVSDERAYYSQLKPYTLKKLDDWPHERYLDLRHPEVRDWLQNQALAFKKMGFDGYWIDNLDVYEEYRFTEMFQGITSALMAVKAVGGYIMVNGGIAYVSDLIAPHKVQLGAYEKAANANAMKKQLKAKNFPATEIKMDGLRKIQAGAFSTQSNADQLVRKLQEAGFTSAKRITLFSGKASAFIDGVTQEEVFSLITNYDKKDEETGKKGIFGKQKKEQSESYQAHIRRLIKAGIAAFLLEYTRSNTLKLRIRAFCSTVGAVAYISDDVDL